jgi:hypothetical protein
MKREERGALTADGGLVGNSRLEVIWAVGGHAGCNIGSIGIVSAEARRVGPTIPKGSAKSLSRYKR